MPEKYCDVLVEIPDGGVSDLLEIIARELPASVYLYEFVKTVVRWRTDDPAYDVALYWHKRKSENGIFISILRSGNKTFGLFLYAVEGFENELQRALLRTTKIKWEDLPLIQGILPRHYDLVERVVKAKNFSPKIYVDTTVQYLDRNIALNYRVDCPSEVYAAPLTSNDVDMIYDHWPHHDVYTRDEIRFSVERGVSFGLYSKLRNQLVAWVMQTHYGAIGMLYTIEHIRRKGYAKTLVKLVAKELVEQSIQPYAMIMANNAASISLFHSIGFKQIIPMRYVSVCKP